MLVGDTGACSKTAFCVVGVGAKAVSAVKLKQETDFKKKFFIILRSVQIFK
jgi:hypothetical protein